MENDGKKGYVIYTLKICYNQDTDEIEYIAEGLDEKMVDFTPINPFNLDRNMTKFFTSEDMATIKKLYDIEEV